MPRSIYASGRAAKRGERREIDVLEPALDRVEASGLLVGKDVDHRTSRDEAGRDHLILRLIIFQLGPADRLLPDPAASTGNQVRGPAFELDPAVRQDRHPRAEVGDVVDD